MHGKAVWMNKLYMTWRTINFNITNNVRRRVPQVRSLSSAPMYIKYGLVRQEEGKSGRHRVIVFFRNEFRTFFTYGFAKSDRGNISRKYLKRFKEDAKLQFPFTEEQIRAALQNGTLIEIIEEDFHRVAMNSINITAHAVKKRK